jgi:hypothetical protein
VSLTGEWSTAQAHLPDGWRNARLELTVSEGDYDSAAALLGPAQPYQAAPGVLRFGVSRDGTGPGVDAVSRLLTRLGEAGIDGTVTVISSEDVPISVPSDGEPTLVESWDAALATLPSDWSDLVGEVDLISSDYLDQAALQLAPINPRLVPPGTVLRFRCASAFGYGASAGMVRRCLERCDEKGIRGSVSILRALCGSQPVGTQGPIWQIGGRTV